MNAAVLNNLFKNRPINKESELAAYEYLWSLPGSSFKTIADLFSNNPKFLPSSFVEDKQLNSSINTIKSLANIDSFNILVKGMLDYPISLRDAKYPVEFLYYKGILDLLFAPKRISIIGTRSPTEEGIRRTRKLARQLINNGFVVFSGLAKGVDTVAHMTAIDEGGMTVAVIGTPILNYYPSENRALQDYIAKKHLLISQVPILRYRNQDYKANRHFFPERNATMSALTHGTVIVEASEASGTLIQARLALTQGRKLFILDSCFNNPKTTWPERFLNAGAIRVREISDILIHF